MERMSGAKWLNRLYYEVIENNGDTYLWPLLHSAPSNIKKSDFIKIITDWDKDLIKAKCLIDSKQTNNIPNVKFPEPLSPLSTDFINEQNNEIQFALMIINKSINEFKLEKNNEFSFFKNLIDFDFNTLSALVFLFAQQDKLFATLYFSHLLLYYKKNSEKNILSSSSIQSESAILGEKLLATLKEAREISAINRSKKSYKKKREWREAAISKWPDNPGWTLNEMAEWIKDETNSKSTSATIKQSLKGIKSSLFKTKSEK